MYTYSVLLPQKTKHFPNIWFSRKQISFWNINVNQQCRYTVRNYKSKLAPNWPTNVNVIDLTFFAAGPLSLESLQTRFEAIFSKDVVMGVSSKIDAFRQLSDLGQKLLILSSSDKGFQIFGKPLQTLAKYMLLPSTPRSAWIFRKRRPRIPCG